MPPNAGPLAAVCANHQQKTSTKDAAAASLSPSSPSIQMKATLAKGQMGEEEEEAKPRLRRSPPAFGGGFFNQHSISSMAFSPTNHLPSSTHSNLHCCAAAFEPSIPSSNNSSFSSVSIAEMSKENVVASSAAVCPAPASQIELEFTLAPSSSSASPSPLQIQIRSPGGDFGQLRLDPTHPNGTFCARKSTRCGHGRWQIRVLAENAENGENLVLEEEKILELDGVGRVHFFWTQEHGGKMKAKGGKGKLEMREREMLWMPGTACCPLMEGKKEGN